MEEDCPIDELCACICVCEHVYVCGSGGVLAAAESITHHLEML